MYGDTSQPQYTPVPQQQQVDSNQQKMTLKEWDVLVANRFHRFWLSENMDDILKQGLARYISTRPNVPDALEPAAAVFKSLRESAHDELKHRYLSGFEGDRKHITGRLESFRDSISRVLAVPFQPKYRPTLTKMFESAPSQEWINYLRRTLEPS